jgi:ethylene receptor
VAEGERHADRGLGPVHPAGAALLRHPRSAGPAPARAPPAGHLRGALQRHPPAQRPPTTAPDPAALSAASVPVFFPRALREDLLRTKARRLDHDLAAIRWREGTAWSVVRRAAVLQLADAFGLRNCAIWTPTPTNGVLQLAHQLVPPDNDAHHQVFDSTTISVADPDVAQVMSSKEGKVLRPGSALGMASGRDQPPAGAAAAIRLPILRVSKIFDQQSNNGNTSPDLMSYAILVLLLPPANTDDHPGSSVPAGGWSTQDLEVVQAVADQVAVALSHADALEESQLIRHKLAEQQAALLQAKREVASATKARNAAHAVMCDAMRRPTHPVVGLLSVMQQEAKLRPDQRLVVDALARTGALSSTLMDDIMESVSAADPPPLSSPCLLARRPFELRALVRNVASVAGCLSGCRGIGFSHGLEAGSSLPEWVVGDDRRVFHLLLHMVDELLSRCHQPHVAGRALSFSACDDQHLIPPPGRRNFSGGGNHVFDKFQVGLTRAQESGGPCKSLPASHRRPPRNRCSGRANTQLNNATCNKIAQVCIKCFFFCFICLLFMFSSLLYKSTLVSSNYSTRYTHTTSDLR